VRHNARSRPQLVEKTWLQPIDEPGQQVDRHHAGLRQIRGEHVALHEAHAVGDTSLPRALARLLHQGRVELDPQAARAEVAGRGDDDPAIAGAQIDHQVCGARAGQLEHALDDLVGGGDERHRRQRFLCMRRYRDEQRRDESRPPHRSRFSIACRTSSRAQSIAPK
jgi:hypothetical protein